MKAAPIIDGLLSDNDFWNDLPTELKYAINEAKSQLDYVEGIPHPQVMAEIKDRFLYTR